LELRELCDYGLYISTCFSCHQCIHELGHCSGVIFCLTLQSFCFVFLSFSEFGEHIERGKCLKVEANASS